MSWPSLLIQRAGWARELTLQVMLSGSSQERAPRTPKIQTLSLTVSHLSRGPPLGSESALGKALSRAATRPGLWAIARECCASHGFVCWRSQSTNPGPLRASKGPEEAVQVMVTPPSRLGLGPRRYMPY